MRLAAYEHHGHTGLALVEPDGLYPLAPGTDLVHLLMATPAKRMEAIAWAERSDKLRLDDVRLLAPLRPPPSMRDFVTFERHVEGVSRAVEGKPGVPDGWYAHPTFCFMSPYAVIGAHDPVPVPAGCELLDYELELAVVIGRDGRDLTPGQAAGHIAGYTIMNDWSARDVQSREMKLGLGPAKGKDFATTLGPWVVSTDALAPYLRDDRMDLEMTVELNGTPMGSDRSGNMAWSFPELIAYASRSAWVRAGDVIASGTCASGALAEAWGRSGRHDPPPLRPGDVVTMTIEGIGSISNEVVAGPAEASPIVPARRRQGVAAS